MTKNLLIAFIVCLLATGASPLTAEILTPDPTPSSSCPILTTPYQASYFGSYKGWRLDTSQKLQSLSNNQWQFELQADNPIGTLTERSIFSLNQQHRMISQTYLHHRRVLLKNDQLDILFDWSQHHTLATRKDKQYQVPLQGGELDNLNYQLAIRCDLLAGLKHFSYRVADRKEIDTLEFKVTGEEKLPTELGVLDTVVVKRIRSNKNRSTTLWFAKDLDYLMVKLLQEERKDAEAYLLYIQTFDRHGSHPSEKQQADR
jgi:hypothetical protein